MRFFKTSGFKHLSDDELLGKYYETQETDMLLNLYNRYLEYVYGLCLKYLKSIPESEDATMEIYHALPAKINRHRVKNFKSWLYVVAKNHCLTIIRGRNKGIIAPFPEELMHSNKIVHHDDEFELSEAYADLYGCIHKLPTLQKQCIELFYLEGRSYQEIADDMVVTKDRVRSYIQNGRRNLRICLAKNGKNG